MFMLDLYRAGGIVFKARLRFAATHASFIRENFLSNWIHNKSSNVSVSPLPYTWKVFARLNISSVARKKKEKERKREREGKAAELRKFKQRRRDQGSHG